MNYFFDQGAEEQADLLPPSDSPAAVFIQGYGSGENFTSSIIIRFK